MQGHAKRPSIQSRSAWRILRGGQSVRLSCEHEMVLSCDRQQVLTAPVKVECAKCAPSGFCRLILAFPRSPSLVFKVPGAAFCHARHGVVTHTAAYFVLLARRDPCHKQNLKSIKTLCVASAMHCSVHVNLKKRVLASMESSAPTSDLYPTVLGRFAVRRLQARARG